MPDNAYDFTVGQNNENDAVRNKKARNPPDKVLFGDSDTAAEVANRLIPQFHPELGSAVIRYIGRSKAAKRSGNPVPGNVYRMSGKFGFLTSCDYVVEVALDIWNGLNPTQRNALMDHLLTRCVGEEDEESGDMKWKLRLPEVQEFPEVAERQGQWNEGLVELASCLKK
jgi:hypothetical protein